ncbi:MAG: hypothetical protein NT013_09930 [Planctomycetia bacterium]|nr:hypothetical protein [Planctomycetia bacterium]
MKCFLFVVVLSLVALINVARAELVSGPGAEKKLDALKVFVATGDQASREVEFIAERKEKPTVYVFVPAEKFSRPMARFIKTLDEKLNSDRMDIDIIVVWLADDVAKTKERLPRVQESLKLNRTTWCVYPGEKTGPNTWGINPDADLTLVIANGPKTTVSRGYHSINETDTPKVFAELPAKK